MTNDINTIQDLGFRNIELIISQALNIIFAVIAFLAFIIHCCLQSLYFHSNEVNLLKYLQKKMEKKAVYFTERMKNWLKRLMIL